jgi:hypothetical protein
LRAATRLASPIGQRFGFGGVSGLRQPGKRCVQVADHQVERRVVQAMKLVQLMSLIHYQILSPIARWNQTTIRRTGDGSRNRDGCRWDEPFGSGSVGTISMMAWRFTD